jgi:hypothetical protein
MGQRMDRREEKMESRQALLARLKWLMVFRVVVVTLLLGATAILQFQEKDIPPFASLTHIYILLGLTYILTFIYALLLPRARNLKTFAYVQILGDVFFVTLLIYF